MTPYAKANICFKGSNNIIDTLCFKGSNNIIDTLCFKGSNNIIDTLCFKGSNNIIDTRTTDTEVVVIPRQPHLPLKKDEKDLFKGVKSVEDVASPETGAVGNCRKKDHRN